MQALFSFLYSGHSSREFCGDSAERGRDFVKRHIYLVSFAVFFLALTSLAMAESKAPLELEELLEHAQERALSLKDFSADVEILQVQPRRTVRTVAFIQASQEWGLMRLELKEPSVLRGQIIVADQETLEVKMYLPIADQIMVRDVESMGQEAGIPLDMDNLGALFDFYDYDVEIRDVLNSDDGYTYVLEVTGIEDQTQFIWLRDSDWVPYMIEVFEDDVLIGTLRLDNVVFDQSFNREELASLPDVRIFRP